MATIGENRAAWSTYPWSAGGHEWSEAWGGSRQVWCGVLLPRIGHLLPTGTILEIGPGRGRWVPFLRDQSQRYLGVDVAGACVAACRAAFPDLAFHENDGRSLPVVADRSVDLCFSYDSLVHADGDTLDAYLGELSRVLADSGAAFLHHSNLGACQAAVRRRRFLGRLLPSGRPRRWLRLAPATHWRDPGVTAARVRASCAAHGLYCRQELIPWLNSAGLLIDCFTWVSRRPLPYRLLVNRQFVRLARQLRLCAEHYQNPDSRA